MAYNFLNTTTYTNQLAQQQQLIAQMQEAVAMQTPLGSGFDLNSYDNDLVEIVDADEVAPQGDVPMQQDVQQPDILDEPEPDDRFDMDLINSMSQETTPAPKPKVQTRTVYVDQSGNETEDESSNHTYRNGKIAPRIWQNGGQVSKYQFGGSTMKVGDANVDRDTMAEIVKQSNSIGINPYVSLGIAYQESRIDKKNPYHLNPKYYPTNLAGPKAGVQSVKNQLDYGRSMQHKGVAPSTQAGQIQGYNGYGKIWPDHADLEGATSIYGIPVPEEGINFRTNPIYGRKIQDIMNNVLGTQEVHRFVDSVSNLPLYQPSRKTGGTLYADDYTTQRIGLNDPNYNTAVFNTKGINTFRGLDNHQPVAITDGKKYQILHGPQDTAKFSGKVYEQKMQTGGEVDADVSKQKLFYERYIQSPKYKERLSRQGYTNPDQVISARLNNVKSTDAELVGGSDVGSYYDMYDSKKVLLDTLQPHFKYYPETVKAHEYGHVAGALDNADPNLVMNKNDSTAIASRNQSTNEHDKRPHETKADMDTLRYFLRRDKIYDASTQDFSPEILKKAKQKYQYDPAMQRLFKNIKSDKDLIYLMNNVAKNDNNIQTEIYG